MGPLWFRPACDTLLLKIVDWFRHYERGEIFSDRDWMHPVAGVVKMPTRYSYRIPFTVVEFKCLVAIMTAAGPTNPLTTDLTNIFESMKRRFNDMPVAQRPRMLSTGEWVVPVAFYKADVEEIGRILLEAKSGVSQRIESIAADQKKQGKDLFEA